MEKTQQACSGFESNDQARYLALAAERRVPLSATFELTHRCNFSCVHCYLGDQQEIRKHRQSELDTSTILNLLDEMVASGTLFLTLTGGEPMLRTDFVTIYTHAVCNGLLVSVYCNGSMVTDEIIDVFVRYPPRIVEITLYGATRKTFEAITQRPNSFTACMDGIEKMRRAGVRLRLKTMVMSLNCDELSSMWNMAEDMKVSFRHDCSIIPVLPNEDNGDSTNIKTTGKNSRKDVLRFRLTPDQAAEADLSQYKVREALRKTAGLDIPFGEPSSCKLFTCGASRASYHLTPYGRMQPCVITPQMSVNIIENNLGLLGGFRKVYEKFATLSATADFLCTTCRDKKFCTGCPAGFVLETDKAETAAFFYCQYAECRRQRLK